MSEVHRLVEVDAGIDGKKLLCLKEIGNSLRFVMYTVGHGQKIYLDMEDIIKLKQNLDKFIYDRLPKSSSFEI